ncbi:hypothetical protein FACS189413_16870 [Bacteroidia bacterium]|nr:hypothetical protein FACS189413_16870 [Bacteroidia bacterium]
MGKKFGKSLALYLFVIIYSSCYFIDKGYKNTICLNDTIYITNQKKQATFYPSEFNEQSRLFYICKVWGFVKYYHENSNKQQPNVDAILLDAMAKNKIIENKGEFQNLLISIISSIQLSPIDEISQSQYPDIKDYMLIDNAWMNDTLFLSPRISEKLHQLFLTHSGNKNPFVSVSNIGLLKLSNEKKYEQSFPDDDVRLLGLFRYWNLINYFFVYKNFMTENWDQILYESIPRFQNVHTTEQYHWEIARLTNALNDAHANMPTLMDTMIVSDFYPPFMMIKIDSLFLVDRILMPIESMKKLKQGDIVLEIDDKEVVQLYDSLRKFIGAGSYWMHQKLVGLLMQSNHKSMMKFKLLRNGKDTLTLNIKNVHYSEVVAYRKKIEKTGVYYKYFDNKTTYLDLNYLDKSNFNKNYMPIKNARTIILDLRCYPDNSLFDKIIDTFVPKIRYFSRITYPDARYPGMIRKHLPNMDIGNDQGFKGNIILLVNERTGSFSEYLTMALQMNPKTITVGRSTAGSDGNIIRWNFPGNISINFSGIGIYYPNMTPTQNIGIKIDYLIEPTVESVVNGTDLILEKAKELAKCGL